MTQQFESDANTRRNAVPLFDPVAGMRAVADIQAEGLRAASELLERVLEPDHRPRADGSPSSVSSPGRDYAGLADAWAEILRRVSAGLAPAGDAGHTTISLDSEGVSPPVRLTVDGHVREAAGEIWLHNGTSAAVGPLTLRCGTLS